MGASEVIQVLQALDVKTLSMSASEKKGELRAQLGLPREVETAASAAPTAMAAGAKAKEMKSDGKVAAPAKKTLPKVAPGSTAEKAGTVGTGAAKGVSKPAGKEVGEKKP